MRNRQRGVAIVEFALVLPLLLLMTFVVTEYSRALYQYNTLTKSVRDAARYPVGAEPGLGDCAKLEIWWSTATLREAGRPLPSA